MSIAGESSWIPEIVYEDSEEGGSSIPFVMVPSDEEMPNLLYIFESRETGDVEPGSDGEEVPVLQWDLHQYADMGVLKQRLDPLTFDLVRASLGLESLSSATEKGQKLTSKIRENIDSGESH
jgi:hypothetical protein